MLSEIVLSSEVVGLLIGFLCVCIAVVVYFLWEDDIVKADDDDSDDTDDDTLPKI